MKSNQPRHGREALSCMCVLAVMCFSIISLPAHAAEKAPVPVPAKAATAAAPEAKLPGDDIALGILSRAKPSDKDNTAVLMPLTGTWDYTESFWTSPKAAPEHAMGSVTNDMILDGHYLSSNAMGSLNIGREQISVQGQELIGFDNAKKSLSFFAADTTTTGMTTGSGKFDAKAKVIRETGRFTNPLTGVEQDFRSELTFVDSTHYKRTIFAADKSGRESKLMEIDYSKRQ